ncbi:hypothetical protein ACS0TY_019545 [Phlomoides rotata]
MYDIFEKYNAIRQIYIRTNKDTRGIAHSFSLPSELQYTVTGGTKAAPLVRLSPRSSQNY